MPPEDEEFDPEDYEGVQERMATLPRKEVRRFEKDRRELNHARAELEQAQRELAFAKAGIDVNIPKFMWFAKGYDGDMDPVSIKEAAVLAELFGNAGASPAEQAGHQAAAAAANGAGVLTVEDEVARQFKEAGSIHWRDGEKAIAEIQRIVNENDIKLHVNQ